MGTGGGTCESNATAFVKWFTKSAKQEVSLWGGKKGGRRSSLRKVRPWGGNKAGKQEGRKERRLNGRGRKEKSSRRGVSYPSWELANDWGMTQVRRGKKRVGGKNIRGTAKHHQGIGRQDGRGGRGEVGILVEETNKIYLNGDHSSILGEEGVR